MVYFPRSQAGRQLGASQAHIFRVTCVGTRAQELLLAGITVCSGTEAGAVGKALGLGAFTGG